LKKPLSKISKAFMTATQAALSLQWLQRPRRFSCTALVAVLMLALTSMAPVVATARSAPAQASAEARLEAQTGGISAYRLPNGFKIILAPYPSAATARVELLVKTGSKLEGYGETGMAHLLEHMLFKGAGARANVKSDLTALGASWNGTTTADRTNYFETIPAEPDKIDAALRIEADRFIRARFTQQDLKSEMTVVRNELERGDSSPDSLVMRALQRQSWFWHGYGRPTIGARSDIEDAPFAALQAFHKKHYRPDNAALIVTGKFDAAHVLKLASQLFAEAKNPPGPPIASWTREESRPITNRSEMTLPAGRTLVASGWKLPGALERQSYALDLASNAICSNDWGTLRKTLVLERKMAINAFCGTDLQKDYALFTAFAGAEKGADAEALSRSLVEHIEAAARAGVTPAQLDRARQEELTGYERIENDHEGLAGQLSAAEVAGDWRLYFWRRDLVSSITADEANAALRKWIVPTNRSDVLLRHAEGVTAPELPRSAGDAAPLVAGKSWPPVAKLSDPIPTSAAELARATIKVDLGDPRAQGVLITRKTQGDLAWVVVGNDYGNEAALRGRTAACGIANGLVAYGGAGLTRDQLSAKLADLKAEWSISLGGVSVEAPRDQVDAALDVLLAAWAAPTLPPAEFDRLKAAALSGIERALKEPSAVAANQAGLRFDNYPTGYAIKPRSLEQQLAEAKAVSYDDVKACVNDFLGVSHVRLAQVGRFTPADVKATWAKLAKLPASKTPYARVLDFDAPTTVNTQPISVAMPEKPNATVMGLAVIPLRDDSPDFPALRLAIKALGGDADSRIWQRLREKEGLAYGAGAGLSGSTFEARSSVQLSATAATDKAEVALASLQDELQRALQGGFTEAEIERAKRNWLQERKNSLRSEDAYASSLASALYSGRDYAWLADYDARIAQVTAAQASAVLRKYLGSAPVVWLVGKGTK
jgi:zinc protease